MDIHEFQKIVFKKGKQNGFDEMELYYSIKKSTKVSVSDNEVKEYSISEQGGVFFRGIYHNNMGCSYTEKIDAMSSDFLIDQAMSNAEILEIDDQEELFQGAAYYETLNRYSEAIANVSSQELIEVALAMEHTALTVNPLVTKVIRSDVEKSECEIVIANTMGLNCHSKDTYISAGLYLMASNGEQTTTRREHDFTFKDFLTLNINGIAAKAAKEAVAKLGAESIDSGNYPIIFRYDTASKLLNSFVKNFSGEAVDKEFSRLHGKLGEKIAGDNITIIEDPLMQAAPGATAFDAEGYPAKKYTLIYEGKLLSFMHNRKTAKKAGTESTGNAIKNSYRATALAGPHNVYLKPGKALLDDIIRETTRGIFIVELQDAAVIGINSLSGDFSLSAIGFLIENGKLSRPVNQITIAGNLYEMLNSIEEIAEDLQIKDTVSSPSVKVKTLTVSGK